MFTDNAKIQPLITLGQPEWGLGWVDYPARYGFTPDDAADLIALFQNQELASMDSQRPEVWASLHAWRALGQLGSESAIAPIIESFDTIFEDDCALGELSRVVGMIGPAAIAPLADYWQQPGKDEFAYVMAMDSLCKVAKSHPESRDEVLAILREYMVDPEQSLPTLNGLLMGNLLDLDAREAIEEIRHMFALECIDITCAGDLEEVEIELGFRSERSTPEPDYSALLNVEAPLPETEAEQKPEDDDVIGIIDYWLMRYGHDESILGVSELDGFFAAIACAPEMIMPSSWMPQIWDGEEHSPEWDSKEDYEQFATAVFSLYNIVNSDLREGGYEPLFLESTVHNTPLSIVDEWCYGFLRGVRLWTKLLPVDIALLEKRLETIRLFADYEDLETLSAMPVDKIVDLQNSIQPTVEGLYRHFFKPVKPASSTFVHTKARVGRNEPCPCGSGKKYKKCCGLN